VLSVWRERKEDEPQTIIPSFIPIEEALLPHLTILPMTLQPGTIVFMLPIMLCLVISSLFRSWRRRRSALRARRR
jgi:hypothetical protein